MKTILIVDDQERIRRVYRRVFEHEGYRVLEAKDAVDADEVITHEKIDLVLLDIKMPDVAGDVVFDIIELFQQDLKVIVSSVYPLNEQRQIIRGAADYFDKSENLKVLKEKVKKVLVET